MAIKNTWYNLLIFYCEIDVAQKKHLFLLFLSSYYDGEQFTNDFRMVSSLNLLFKAFIF